MKTRFTTAGFHVEGYGQTKTASASCFTPHSSRNYVYIFIELTNWREMLSNRYVALSLFLTHDNLHSRFTDH